MAVKFVLKYNVDITKNNNLILQGSRNHVDGLWDVVLNSSKTSSNKNTNKTQLNYIITKDKSKTELAQYLHAAMFSPAISTITKAIKTEI